MHRRHVLQLGMLTAAGSFIPKLSGASFDISSHHASSEFSRIRLSANENVYGPAPSAKEAIKEALGMANRYPLVESLPALKKEIAAYHRVPESMVFITPGSLHALKVIGARLGKDGGNHVAADLSYSVLMRQSELSGCTWKKVPVTKEKAIDLDELKRAIDDSTQFIYVTNPNNPTGHYIDHAILKSFCEEVATDYPLIVDEAYIEFVSGDERPSMVPLLTRFPNMIVTRTFSKIYGLAGLRVGYALAKEEWIKDWEQWDQTAGIGVSNVAAQAALASLRDEKFLKESREKIGRTRAKFIKELRGLEIKTYPSWTNFVLVETAGLEARLAPALASKNIDVVLGRPGPLNGLARISIGTDEEMNILTQTLKSIK